jgi:hypothetical protein
MMRMRYVRCCKVLLCFIAVYLQEFFCLTRINGMQTVLIPVKM